MNSESVFLIREEDIGISQLPAVAPNCVGSVMVVGGGIAGMQASLDLADQGFKVYLVESKSAIGGNMARLDKTFPTNDCAMCTISPKLVETGRHPNIQLLTNTEVLDIKGQAGNFNVHLRQNPRYVDLEKCVACGDCTKVCPVIVPDTFNEGLNTRRAIAKLYPQAVPNAYAIEKRGIAPCRDACPTGQRAQGYIALIREGRWQDALRVIKMDNPFPGICGRICNHRCETACNRGQVDEAVNIRALKRFVTDKVYGEPRQPVAAAELKYPGSPVAIIGAGPCGLTAAQDLIRAGYPVTIFESMPVAGGMLRLGVPEYRLPAEIVDREVQDIIDLGVDLRLNTRVDNLDTLFQQGYSAVLISVGAHEGVRLRIPGSELKGVLVNTHFLRDLRLGKYKPLPNQAPSPEQPGAANTDELHSTAASQTPEPLGKHVLILGGGNVAIDCARSAVRQLHSTAGCTVAMACLEDRQTMPAHPWEIQAAEAEGIQIHPGRTFERILGDEHGQVTGVECMHVASFRFDETGRLHVEKIPHSEHIIPCDSVIFSVGQRAGLAFIPDDAGVGITEKRTIAINPNTMAATRPGVFAAGDSVSGTAFVVEAVSSGHKAAESILRYLRGDALEPPAKPALPVVHLSSQELNDRVSRGEIKIRPRIPLPELPVARRLDSFVEVEGGYDDSSAQAEAARCLACGICSECMSCVFACGVQAINHDMPAKELEMEVGAVILAPGYQVYRAELSEEYGFGRYPNVVTALQYERLMSASGPTMGKIHRPSDDQLPKRIAFLQCVGSRDQNHDYCSAVCCMYATKEAIMTKEHHPELDIQVFMMDLRAFSKGYLSYFERAKNHYGIQYTRCRVSSLQEDPFTHNLNIKYQSENGELHQAQFDLVVLSVGMEISEAVRKLGRQIGVELDEYGFCHTVQFNPIETSRPGIYAVGPFREPKDIPESVVEASGAAAAAAARLNLARNQLTVKTVYPQERQVLGEPPRIGVFVCHCGSNIAGYLDVPDVTAYARSLPNVVHAENNLYTCSQDSVRHITEQIQALQLNRVVVASCTPLTHQPLFQDSLRSAALNPYLFEMANIRNQCSWVHSQDPINATLKAKDLVRMAVFRASLLEPQQPFSVPVEKTALVIGGGAAGLMSTLSLAEQGFVVHLVEKEAVLGGNLRHVFTSTAAFVPANSSSAVGYNYRNPQMILQRLIEAAQANSNISIHLQSQIKRTSGTMGNFTSVIEDCEGQRTNLAHGITILATGAQEYRGPEYGYGTHPRIVTQQEFEALLHEQPAFVAGLKSIVMILCVGPAEKYCTRICCTISLKNALALRERNAQAQITMLYQDIRAYGFKERLYTQARREQVLFMRYDPDHRPEIIFEQPQSLPGQTDPTSPVVLNCGITIRAFDHALEQAVDIPADLLVLSMPVVANPNSHNLAEMFKIPIDASGFFMEAHVKLRPVDFATDGIFMAGLCHYPKLIDETLIQAQAAAARAARLLSQDYMTAGGRVAIVDTAKCTGCLTCVRICPFQVPKIHADLFGAGQILGAAFIEPTVCQGCGSCVAECPARAIELKHYTTAQVNAKVKALFPAEALGIDR